MHPSSCATTLLFGKLALFLSYLYHRKTWVDRREVLMLLKSDLAVGDLSVLRVFPFPIISYFYSRLLKDNYRKSTQITTRKKNHTLIM